MKYNRLRAQLVLQGKNMNEFASALGISKSALSRKMNGKTEFKRKEISRAMQYLQLDDPGPIFFNEEVS